MSSGTAPPHAEDAASEPLRRALAAVPHRTGRLRRGYAVEEVDAFLQRARRACAGPGPRLTSRQVRTAGFRLVLGGYDVESTDAVLAGLEDALARLERARALAGPQRREWLQSAATLQAAVRARAQAPDGQRFPRGRRLERTYHRGDVDQLCRLVAASLAQGPRLAPQEVRAALFRPRRGRRGYREVPVDAFCDRVVELLTVLEAAPASPERPAG